MPHRIEQVNQLIKEELGKIILREVDACKDAMLTITKVDSSANLQIVNVYVSAIIKEKEQSAFEELRRNTGDMQYLLNRKLRMRPVPKIIFKLDTAFEKENKLYEILSDIEKNPDIM